MIPNDGIVGNAHLGSYHITLSCKSIHPCRSTATKRKPGTADPAPEALRETGRENLGLPAAHNCNHGSMRSIGDIALAYGWAPIHTVPPDCPRCSFAKLVLPPLWVLVAERGTDHPFIEQMECRLQ
jgi:hypothetical protein